MKGLKFNSRGMVAIGFMLALFLSSSVPLAAATDDAIAPLASKDKVTVLVFLSAHCQCSTDQIEELKSLSKNADTAKIDFKIIDVTQELSSEDRRKYFRSINVSAPVTNDEDLRIADAVKATKTPQAIILNTNGQEVFRGSILDNHDHALLKPALDAALANRPYVKTGKDAFGCAIRKGLLPRRI